MAKSANSRQPHKCRTRKFFWYSFAPQNSRSDGQKKKCIALEHADLKYWTLNLLNMFVRFIKREKTGDLVCSYKTGPVVQSHFGALKGTFLKLLGVTSQNLNFAVAKVAQVWVQVYGVNFCVCHRVTHWVMNSSRCLRGIREWKCSTNNYTPQRQR